MAQQRKHIADFGLQRVLTTGRHFNPVFYYFLTPFIGEPVVEADWRRYTIRRIDNGKVILGYAVSVEKKTLAVFYAHLRSVNEPFGRFTNMRLHEMIVDSWVAEGHQPEALQHLGISNVHNLQATAHMIREFKDKKTKGLKSKGRITLRPGATDSAAAFNDNPFLRCGLSVAKGLDELSDLNIELKKADYSKSGEDEEDPDFHIVMQLGDRSANEVEDVKLPDATPSGSSAGGDDSDDSEEVLFGGRRISNKRNAE